MPKDGPPPPPPPPPPPQAETPSASARRRAAARRTDVARRQGREAVSRMRGLSGRSGAAPHPARPPSHGRPIDLPQGERETTGARSRAAYAPPEAFPARRSRGPSSGLEASDLDVDLPVEAACVGGERRLDHVGEEAVHLPGSETDEARGLHHLRDVVLHLRERGVAHDPREEVARASLEDRLLRLEAVAADALVERLAVAARARREHEHVL